eukprot:scaffold130081_cov74-Cyclotella_meneghiniana.AAC.6
MSICCFEGLRPPSSSPMPRPRHAPCAWRRWGSSAPNPAVQFSSSVLLWLAMGTRSGVSTAYATEHHK